MKNKRIKPDEIRQEKEEVLIVEEILKKYNVLGSEEEIFDKFLSDPGKNEKLLLQSPTYRLSGLIKDYSDNKLLLKDLAGILKKEYDISEEKAKDMAEELNERILQFLKPTAKKRTARTVPQEKQRIKKSPAKDAYRETIE